MDEQAQAAQRALSFQPRNDVVGELYPLQRLAEHELARVEDEGIGVRDLDRLGELLHRLTNVDERVARVVEDPEAPVDAHVHARRLHHRLVERIDDDPPGLDLRLDGAIAEDHRSQSIPARRRPGSPRAAAKDTRAPGVPSLKLLGAPPIRAPEMAERQTAKHRSRTSLEGGSSRASSRRAWRPRPAGAAMTSTSAPPATRTWSTRPTGRRPATGAGRSALRCPECEWNGGGSYSQEVVDRFDEALERGTESVLDDLNILVRANMEDQIDRFVSALTRGPHPPRRLLGQRPRSGVPLDDAVGDQLEELSLVGRRAASAPGHAWPAPRACGRRP